MICYHVNEKSVCEPDDEVPEYVSLPELSYQVKEVQPKTTEQNIDFFNDVHT